MNNDIRYGQKANPKISIDRSDQGRLTVTLVINHSNHRHIISTTEDGDVPRLLFYHLFVFLFLPAHENIRAANTVFRIANFVFRMMNFPIRGTNRHMRKKKKREKMCSCKIIYQYRKE